VRVEKEQHQRGAELVPTTYGPKAGNDQATSSHDTLKRLAKSITELRRSSDVDGLRRVQVEAEGLARDSKGRVRRKAERLSRRARSAIDVLRPNGGETPEERAAREIREFREASWKTRQMGVELTGRILSTLRLLLGDDNLESEAATSFTLLTRLDDEERLRIEIPESFKTWLPSIIDGYTRSLSVFSSAGTESLKNERRVVERALKSVAVDLMTHGTEVRGLQEDAVPLVAYALFNGIVPAVPGVDHADTDEQVNDLLLGVADEVAQMLPEDRRVFISLFRLSVLLGEAQAYADHLSLAALSVSGSPSETNLGTAAQKGSVTSSLRSLRSP